MKKNQPRLTRTENRLLAMLEKKPGIAVSRREIMAEVWPQAQYNMNAATVDKHISMLRGKLRDGRKILSVYGTGYRLLEKPGRQA